MTKITLFVVIYLLLFIQFIYGISSENESESESSNDYDGSNDSSQYGFSTLKSTKIVKRKKRKNIPLYQQTTQPTMAPSYLPSKYPSKTPSIIPSKVPTKSPTFLPSKWPSVEPTNLPSGIPSHLPSNVPSELPTILPTEFPTHSPSKTPSKEPSKLPSQLPSHLPSSIPSKAPSNAPSNTPSNAPSNTPSKLPTMLPTIAPTNKPTLSPAPKYITKQPTTQPSITPSTKPTSNPTAFPTSNPTLYPTLYPKKTAEMEEMNEETDEEKKEETIIETGGVITGEYSPNYNSPKSFTKCNILNQLTSIGCFNMCKIRDDLKETICVFNNDLEIYYETQNSSNAQPKYMLQYLNINVFKEDILSIFNYYRGITAIYDTTINRNNNDKSIYNSPKSKNMNLIHWDYGLYKMSNYYLKMKCHKNRDILTKNDFINFDNDRPDPNIFKNDFEFEYINAFDYDKIWGWMVYIPFLNYIDDQDIPFYVRASMITYWLSKTSNNFYNWNKNECKQDIHGYPDPNCLFFKRQIYGDLCHIGCDYTFECGRNTNRLLLTCFAYNIPQYIKKHPYFNGEPCSDCATNVCSVSVFDDITKMSQKSFWYVY